MKGFISASFPLDTTRKIFRIGSREDIIRENKIMTDAGFSIDRKNDVYVREGFGAYKSNVDKEIESIEDLKQYRDPIFGENPYEEVLEEIKKGYEFVIGPAAPSLILGCSLIESANGLYCKNYLEIVARETR